MTLLSTILDKIPDYVPKDKVRFEDELEFRFVTPDTPKTVYSLEAAPIDRLTEVTSVTDGMDVEYDIGSEVEPRDANGDGKYDSVAFLDTDAIPNDGDSVTVKYVAESNLKRYTDPFDEEVEAIGDDLNDVLRAKYIETADGQELDLIGEGFGEVGRRSGRSDDAYREYLKSLNRAFNARGTKEDILFVTTGLFRVDESDVTIEEDYEKTGFDVDIDDPEINLNLDSVNELIELASPTGVELLSSVSLVRTHNIVITSSSSFTDLSRIFVGIQSDQTSIDRPRISVLANSGTVFGGSVTTGVPITSSQSSTPLPNGILEVVTSSSITSYGAQGDVEVEGPTSTITDEQTGLSHGTVGSTSERRLSSRNEPSPYQTDSSTLSVPVVNADRSSSSVHRGLFSADVSISTTQRGQNVTTTSTFDTVQRGQNVAADVSSSISSTSEGLSSGQLGDGPLSDVDIESGLGAGRLSSGVLDASVESTYDSEQPTTEESDHTVLIGRDSESSTDRRHTVLIGSSSSSIKRLNNVLISTTSTVTEPGGLSTGRLSSGVLDASVESTYSSDTLITESNDHISEISATSTITQRGANVEISTPSTLTKSSGLGSDTLSNGSTLG